MIDRKKHYCIFLIIFIFVCFYSTSCYAVENPKYFSFQHYYDNGNEEGALSWCAKQVSSPLQAQVQCLNAGCSYKDGKCVPQPCNEGASCGEKKYCDIRKGEIGKCDIKDNLTCDNYLGSQPVDNWGKECDTSDANQYSVADNFSKQYSNPNYSKIACKNFYNLRKYVFDAPKYSAVGVTTCKVVFGEFTQGYEDCKAGNLKFLDLYNNYCEKHNNEKTPCSNGQISYYVDAGDSSSTGFHCEDISSGGGISKCPENYDYVANGYEINCYSDSCRLADCSGGGDAVPINLDPSIYYDPYVDIYLNGKYNREYNTAYMYKGTCNGKTTDVFCIDPAAKYHDNGAGYMCDASLNEEGITDAGFIKIYQEAIYKYKDEMSNMSQPLSSINGQAYAGIHLALRLWTFYSGFGKYGDGEGNRAHNNNIAHAFTGTSQHLLNNPANNKISNSDKSIRDYYNDTFGQRGVRPYAFASGGGNASAGYRDATGFFRSAAGEGEIWKNPLEFKLVNFSASSKKATIKLVNINKLIDSSYINWNFVRNIKCDSNCTLDNKSLENITLMQNGNLENVSDEDNGSITFEVSIIDVSKKFKVSVNYYDRRDAKNIIIATASKGTKADYQRLLFIAHQPRNFTYEKEFGNLNNTCVISGGVYFGIDGKSLGTDKNARNAYVSQCCASIESYETEFCAKDHNKTAYCQNGKVLETWVNNGCKVVCNPTNTTDKCDKEEKINKNIVISDLTNGNDAGIGYDDYCYGCTSAASTDLANNSYVAVSNKYCNVLCVEEYKFNVPTHLNVNNNPNMKYGRYLDLKVSASSTRTCYTDPSKAIDYDEFYKDMGDYNKKIQDAINVLNQLNNDYEKVKDINNVKVDSNIECKSASDPGKVGEKYALDAYGNIVGDSLGPCQENLNNRTVTCQNWSESKASVSCGSITNYSYGKWSSNGSCNYPGVATCDGGSKSDGTHEDLINKVRDDRDDQLGKVNQLIREYNQIISDYNSCSTFNLNACYNGKGETDAPYIEFTYDESYYMNLLGNQNNLVADGTWNGGETERKYYGTSSIVESSCGFKNEQVDKIKTISDLNNSFYKYSCDSNGKCTQEKGTQQIHVNNFVKTTYNYSTTLRPQAYWYTKTPSGEATLKKTTNNIDLGYYLPISRECSDKYNPYKYTLTFKNLGQYNDNSCRLGRLSNVINKMEYNNRNDAEGAKQGKYSCDYEVTNKSCEGCESLYYYRSVSLNDLFTKVSEFHDMSNGNKTITNKVNVNGTNIEKKNGNRIIYDYTWSSPKGQDTKKAIEELGEGAYTKEHLQYSYELTPAGMKRIREYNDKAETIAAGGYGDFNLTCDGYKCLSSFLTQIDNNEFQGVKTNKRNTSFELYNGKPWK